MEGDGHDSFSLVGIMEGAQLQNFLSTRDPPGFRAGRCSRFPRALAGILLNFRIIIIIIIIITFFFFFRSLVASPCLPNSTS